MASQSPPPSGYTVEEERGARLNYLLCDEAVRACRIVFHKTLGYPEDSYNLHQHLATNHSKFRKLRGKVINESQWNLLFPLIPRLPDSMTFDITLWMIILRVTCPGILPPQNGWNNEPSKGDTSISANLIKLRLQRNIFRAHITRTSLTENEFNAYWQETTDTLVALGIPSEDLEKRKTDSFDPRLAQENADLLNKLWETENLLDNEVGNIKQRISKLESTYLAQEVKTKKREDVMASQSSGKGQSDKIPKPLPETSVHFELSKKFAENIGQGENPDWKHLSDSVLFINTDQFIIGVGSNNTTVFIGYHFNFHAWVAIKRCLINHGTTKQEIDFIRTRNFRNKHSNIGAFIDCIEADPYVYLILELYEETLTQYFARNPDVDFKMKCKFVFDLLQGIDFLHNQNIIHRDLKPQNILIDNSGVLKIVDFGISRQVDISQTITYETITQGTIFWLPPYELSSIGCGGKGKVKEQGDVFVTLMLIFYVFSGGQHPFMDLNNKNLMKYMIDVSSFNFFKKLKDPFLQRVLEEMFKQTSSIKQVTDIIVRLNETHRIREVVHKSSEMYERTPGKRYAILIACTNILDTAHADATVLKSALENCGFSVEPRNNISKEQLLSSEIEDNSNRIEPIALTLKKIQEDTTQSEDIYIFLHVSTHGYRDESLDDTFLIFEDGVASVKEITNQVFDIINIPNVNLIFTVETCREETKGNSSQLEFPNSPFVVFYSTGKGAPSADPGRLPESFACAGPFSQALEREIKPAMQLGRIFEKVKSGMKEQLEFPEQWLPEAEYANHTAIYNFVF